MSHSGNSLAKKKLSKAQCVIKILFVKILFQHQFIHFYLSYLIFFAKTFLNSSSFEQVEQLQEKVRENSTYEKNIEHKKNKLSGFWRERLLPII